MNFVYPHFLWAYFLILIPIIVHLFNFRRYKTVYFSRVSHLREITQDSKSGVKLKHLLVLASRILAILALVTAFAQPFIPLDKSGESTENVTSIYIDNSYSMQATGRDGDLLNETKNQAIDLVRSFDENERINLLTTDLLSLHQRFYTKSEVIDMIKAIELSPRSTSLDVVLGTQTDLLSSIEEKVNRRIFMFSDFQQSTSTLDGFNREPVNSYFYYQAKSEQEGNIFVDSVWFLSPVHRVDNPVELHFRIRNESDINDSLSVSLSINGNEPGPKKIGVAPHSYTEDKIVFTDRTPGVKSGVLHVKTGHLFFDDDLYFTYEIKESVDILIIKENENDNLNLEQLYGLDDYYQAESATIGNVRQEQFKGKELIIFQNTNLIPDGIRDLADKALNEGATVVLIPGRDMKLNEMNTWMNSLQLPSYSALDTGYREVSYFNADDPLYTGVFESRPQNFKHPEMRDGYKLQVSSQHNFITLFGFNSSTPFLLYSAKSNGRFVQMASPLDLKFSNFQNHALFAATFLRLAETASFQKPIYLTMGSLVNFPVKQQIDEKKSIHLKHESSGLDIIPQLVRVNNGTFVSFSHLEDQLKEAGFYTLEDGFQLHETIAINYNREESYIEALDNEALQQMFTDAGWSELQQLQADNSGRIEINRIQAKEYWRILLILTLIFIAIEVLLLRFWKT